MANFVIKTQKVRGKGRVYTEVCPVNNCYRVGNPRCCNSNCPHFVKFTTNKLGEQVVHCEPPKVS